MKYTVVWKPSAQRRLAEIWMSTSDRAAIARTADDIDRMLGTQPLQIGESREVNSRILVEPPLAVVYDVSPDDRLVSVLSVRALPERGESRE
jgi:hypothetical protein